MLFLNYCIIDSLLFYECIIVSSLLFYCGSVLLHELMLELLCCCVNSALVCCYCADALLYICIICYTSIIVLCSRCTVLLFYLLIIVIIVSLFLYYLYCFNAGLRECLRNIQEVGENVSWTFYTCSVTQIKKVNALPVHLFTQVGAWRISNFC